MGSRRGKCRSRFTRIAPPLDKSKIGREEASPETLRLSTKSERASKWREKDRGVRTDGGAALAVASAHAAPAHLAKFLRQPLSLARLRSVRLSCLEEQRAFLS